MISFVTASEKDRSPKTGDHCVCGMVVIRGGCSFVGHCVRRSGKCLGKRTPRMVKDQ